MKIFCILTGMVVIWRYIFTRTHWIICLTSVHFIVCKLCLNKVDFKKNTVDSWTAWVWTVCARPLLCGFFFSITMYYTIHGWLNLHMQNWYRGLTVKLYANFWLHGGSAPLTSSSFKGQLYIKTSALLYASKKQNLNFKKPPFKMATQTTEYLGKNKNTWDLNGKNYKTHIIFN